MMFVRRLPDCHKAVSHVLLFMLLIMRWTTIKLRREILQPNYSGKLSLAPSHIRGLQRSYNVAAYAPAYNPGFYVHS